MLSAHCQVAQVIKHIDKGLKLTNTLHFPSRIVRWSRHLRFPLYCESSLHTRLIEDCKYTLRWRGRRHRWHWRRRSAWRRRRWRLRLRIIRWRRWRRCCSGLVVDCISRDCWRLRGRVDKASDPVHDFLQTLLGVHSTDVRIKEETSFFRPVKYTSVCATNFSLYSVKRKPVSDVLVA
jgi:hypothetical protein